MSDDNKDTSNNNDGSQTSEADASGTSQTRQYTPEEFKDLISQRDNVKKEKAQLQAELEKFRQAEADKLKKELEAKGEYDSIIKAKDEELNSVKTKIQEQNEFIEKVRIDLLSKLSDEHKPIAEKLSLSDLQVYVNLNSQQAKPGTDTGKPGGASKIDVTGKSWDDLNSKDKQELLTANPEAYRKLFYNKFRSYPPVN